MSAKIKATGNDRSCAESNLIAKREKMMLANPKAVFGEIRSYGNFEIGYKYVQDYLERKKDIIVVWFSSGAASAVAAKKTIEQYGDSCTVRIINNPIKEEDSDNIRFLRDVEKWLGVEIEIATNSKYPSCSAVDVWEKRRFMSGVAGAPCTLELKKIARQQWEMDNDADWHVLGFTSEEEGRFCNFQQKERLNTLPVLIEAGLSKADCYKVLQDAGIKPPRIYEMGYPNANCIGCVKATSPTYWNHVRRMHPAVFEQRAVQSRDIGARLVRVNGSRIFLDELDPQANGRPMKTLDFECGIFCHTGEDD